MESWRGRTRVVVVGIGAVAALVGGFVHLKLYNDGYKDIPVGHVGTQFILNAVGAVLIAAGLLGPLVVRALPRLVVVAAAAGGVLWAAIGLLAFFRARTASGWFGFQDQPGVNPSPEAALAVYSESVTLVACLVVLVLVVVARGAGVRGRVAAPTS